MINFVALPKNLRQNARWSVGFPYFKMPSSSSASTLCEWVMVINTVIVLLAHGPGGPGESIVLWKAVPSTGRFILLQHLCSNIKLCPVQQNYQQIAFSNANIISMKIGQRSTWHNGQLEYMLSIITILDRAFSTSISMKSPVIIDPQQSVACKIWLNWTSWSSSLTWLIASYHTSKGLDFTHYINHRFILILYCWNIADCSVKQHQT